MRGTVLSIMSNSTQDSRAQYLTPWITALRATVLNIMDHSNEDGGSKYLTSWITVLNIMHHSTEYHVSQYYSEVPETHLK